MGFSGKRFRCPIIRYGWKDALASMHEGCHLLRLEDGHAEILNNKRDDGGAVGFLTRRSLELLDKYLAARAAEGE